MLFCMWYFIFVLGAAKIVCGILLKKQQSNSLGGYKRKCKEKSKTKT